MSSRIEERLQIEPKMAHRKNTWVGENLSEMLKIANNKVPRINPDWTAEVSKLRALEDSSKTEISSGITALPANHNEVPQNCANTITGNIREGIFKND